MLWKPTVPQQLATPGFLDSVFKISSTDEPAVSTSYLCKAAFDFGRIPSKEFFGFLSCMQRKATSASMLVVALEPDPVAYYQRHFGAVPAFVVDSKTTDEDFINALNWDPDGGGADSIACHAEKVAIIPEPTTFVVLGERMFELGRLFVRPELVGLHLEECLPPAWRYTNDDILQTLLSAGVQVPLAREISEQLV